MHPSIGLFIFVPIDLSTYPPIYLYIHPSIHTSIYLTILPIYLSQSFFPGRSYLSIYRSIDLSIYLSVYLSIYLFVCLSVCLTASFKTQQFCETSSIFELDNIKNETILRDFLIFPS